MGTLLPLVPQTVINAGVMIYDILFLLILSFFKYFFFKKKSIY